MFNFATGNFMYGAHSIDDVSRRIVVLSFLDSIIKGSNISWIESESLRTLNLSLV